MTIFLSNRRKFDNKCCNLIVFLKVKVGRYIGHLHIEMEGHLNE